MRKYNQFILEKLNEEIKLMLEGQLHASSDFLRKLFDCLFLFGVSYFLNIIVY